MLNFIDLFSRSILFNRYSVIDLIEFMLRTWMGYTLISNSGIGIITPLEDLGLSAPIYNILKAMWDTGFMMHLVKGIELVVGLLLIFNIFIPLALMAIVPVVINIYGFHLFLFGGYLTSGLYMILICMFLGYRYRFHFIPLLSVKKNKM